jgi:hypothetical protein
MVLLLALHGCFEGSHDVVGGDQVGGGGAAALHGDTVDIATTPYRGEYGRAPVLASRPPEQGARGPRLLRRRSEGERSLPHRRPRPTKGGCDQGQGSRLVAPRAAERLRPTPMPMAASVPNRRRRPAATSRGGPRHHRTRADVRRRVTPRPLPPPPPAKAPRRRGAPQPRSRPRHGVPGRRTMAGARGRRGSPRVDRGPRCSAGRGAREAGARNWEWGAQCVPVERRLHEPGVRPAHVVGAAAQRPLRRRRDPAPRALELLLVRRGAPRRGPDLRRARLRHPGRRHAHGRPRRAGRQPRAPAPRPHAARRPLVLDERRGPDGLHAAGPVAADRQPAVR